MRSINLNALKMFDVAARHENFSHAADELNLTQGAIAQQIRALEARLGKPLFNRLPRGLALTEAGRAYHSEIRKALQIIDDATHQFTEVTSVTLSVTPSLASKWLMPNLPQLVEYLPNIDLKIHASEQKTDLSRGDADLSIRQGPRPIDSGLEVLPLADLNYIAVARPGLCSENLTLDQLLQHNLIQDSHAHWDQLCADLDKPAPKATLRFNQTALALDAAANGQGIALTPHLLAQGALSAGILQAVWSDPRKSDQGFYILYPKATASEDTRQLANYLAALATI